MNTFHISIKIFKTPLRRTFKNFSLLSQSQKKEYI